MCPLSNSFNFGFQIYFKENKFYQKLYEFQNLGRVTIHRAIFYQVKNKFQLIDPLNKMFPVIMCYCIYLCMNRLFLPISGTISSAYTHIYTLHISVTGSLPF